MRYLNCLLWVGLCVWLALPSRAQTAPSPYDQQTSVTTTTVFVDAKGVQWRQTCVETRTVTYAQITAPVVPAPAPTPSPTPSATLTYQTTSGQAITAARAGDTVVILGSGFGPPAPAGNRVLVGGAIASLQKWSDTSVTVTVPALPPLASATVELYSLASVSSTWSLVAKAAGLAITQ